MSVRVRFDDNSDMVLSAVHGNVISALTAMGTEAVGQVVKQMQTGYGKPIWQTGNLQRDVSFEVERSGENTVDVGNSLEYALFVHEGTSRMGKRPYIRDGIMNNIEKLKKIASAYLKAGM